jgi:hypothetical protein
MRPGFLRSTPRACVVVAGSAQGRPEAIVRESVATVRAEDDGEDVQDREGGDDDEEGDEGFHLMAPSGNGPVAVRGGFDHVRSGAQRDDRFTPVPC